MKFASSQHRHAVPRKAGDDAGRELERLRAVGQDLDHDAAAVRARAVRRRSACCVKLNACTSTSRLAPSITATRRASIAIAGREQRFERGLRAAASPHALRAPRRRDARRRRRAPARPRWRASAMSSCRAPGSRRRSRRSRGGAETAAAAGRCRARCRRARARPRHPSRELRMRGEESVDDRVVLLGQHAARRVDEAAAGLHERRRARRGCAPAWQRARRRRPAAAAI